MSNSFLANSSQTLTYIPSSIDAITNWLAYHIIYPNEAYIIPVLVFLAIWNNVLVLLVFITSKDVAKLTKQSIRIYYIAMAVGDAFVPIPFHLTYFLGINLLSKFVSTSHRLLSNTIALSK